MKFQDVATGLSATWTMNWQAVEWQYVSVSFAHYSCMKPECPDFLIQMHRPGPAYDGTQMLCGSPVRLR